MTNTLRSLFLSLGVAAIAAIAVLAIALTAAAPTEAQTPPYADPKPCNTNDTPDNPVEVIDRGHYALFDAFWDFENDVLHNNLCPPSVRHTIETNQRTGEMVERTYRNPDSTNIDTTRTIIQIGDAFHHILTQEDIDAYPFLYNAETNIGVGSKVWWLRLDDPDTPQDEESDMVLGFSAGLLDSQYWYREGPSAPDRDGIEPLGYEFEVIREPGIPHSEHGHVYAFEPAAAGAGEEGEGAIWDSTDLDANEIAIWPSEYRHVEWVFTKPAVYQLGVHMKAHVRQEPPPGASQWEGISEHKVETSEVRAYTFHVGTLVDLEVQLEADLAEPTQGETGNGTVTYTVTASNLGPDPASNPVAQIHLPEGLTYDQGSASHTVTHTHGTVAWDIGELAAPAEGASPVSRALTFTAAVDDAGVGRKLTARAEIRELERHNLERDHSNNAAHASVAPAQITMNRAPLPVALRQVHEHARRETAVGAPVLVSDADMDPLTFTLSGRGAELFHVDSNGQIAVAHPQLVLDDAITAGLDYETKWLYALRLDVSDGKEHDGAEDSGVDQSMEVRISLEDVSHDPTLLLEVDREGEEIPLYGEVTLRAVPSGLPETAENPIYHYWVKEPDNPDWYTQIEGAHWTVSRATAREVKFYVEVEYRANGRWHGIVSNIVTVAWGDGD